jgi:hypothetical protein
MSLLSRTPRSTGNPSAEPLASPFSYHGAMHCVVRQLGTLERLLEKDGSGDVAYSVGSNRRDDGGDVTVGWRDGDRSAPDPGIRIRYAK